MDYLLEAHETIATAVARGITVLVVAGNGRLLSSGNFVGEDIDPYMPVDDNGNMADSGSIIVSAAGDPSKTGAQWTREPYANFGQRVDCFALGTGARTLSSNDAAANDKFTFLPQTSGATAIVAGAAVVVQSVYRKKHNTPLYPETLRDLFRRTDLNTPTTPVVASEPIGVMPDLPAMLRELDSNGGGGGGGGGPVSLPSTEITFAPPRRPGDRGEGIVPTAAPAPQPAAPRTRIRTMAVRLFNDTGGVVEFAARGSARGVAYRRLARLMCVQPDTVRSTRSGVMRTRHVLCALTYNGHAMGPFHIGPAARRIERIDCTVRTNAHNALQVELLLVDANGDVIGPRIYS